MDLRSMLAVVVTAVIAAIGLPAGAAAGDQILLGGGAAIVLHDDTLCTLTAMGHDSDGRLIGFTSAHCGGPGSEVVAEGAEERGTVGTVVAADDAVGYAVIEFDPVKVKPIADYEGFGIFGIGPPEPEPANPEPAAAKQACKLGQGTGLNCYDIGPDGVNTTAEEWWQPGDDGSPITMDNLIVGMVRDGSTPVAPLDQSGPGIVMFKEVLADVNAKGGPGAGFGLG
ncbi:serine protease [Mycobacterium sp. CSUR Q5927]|nr:serine protease [Mycobacterium sp. CSUR Q5927]